jgi:adenine-specific DNA-methyltransferase
VWAYATEKKLKPGQQLRADTMEELIRRKEIYFPPCKPSEVMQFDTKDGLVEAIRAGKGPVLPKKKKPLLREDLPDLDFWVGKPIAPGRPSRKDFLSKKEKMVAPVTSWIAGEKEVVDFIYDAQQEQAELLRSARGGEGNDALVAILGRKAFDHPKPPSLIRALVQQSAFCQWRCRQAFRRLRLRHLLSAKSQRPQPRVILDSPSNFSPAAMPRTTSCRQAPGPPSALR